MKFRNPKNSRKTKVVLRNTNIKVIFNEVLRGGGEEVKVIGEDPGDLSNPGMPNMKDHVS